jgi:hypothetical protein
MGNRRCAPRVHERRQCHWERSEFTPAASEQKRKHM